MHNNIVYIAASVTGVGNVISYSRIAYTECNNILCYSPVNLIFDVSVVYVIRITLGI